jgi:hypothetical protein
LEPPGNKKIFHFHQALLAYLELFEPVGLTAKELPPQQLQIDQKPKHSDHLSSPKKICGRKTLSIL